MFSSEERRSALADFGKMLAVMALCTAAGYLFFFLGLNNSNITMLYILGVLIIAILANGRLFSLLSPLVAVLIYNFCFTRPYYSFRSGPDDFVTFGVMFLIALLGSSLMVRIKQQNAARQQAEERARQEALRADLLRAISHDLRTPLTSISGNASILLEEAGGWEEPRRRSLYAAIYDDSIWLIQLVENLLSITRIQDGRLGLNRQPELLQDVFQDALAHLDRNKARRQITVDLPDDLLMAEMDARLIVQVLINLLNNAIQYTPPDSHIVLGARREGANAVVTVADDGPGVPAAAREHLFEMFYTAENARADGRRGMGLGLALCKSIVQAHGGEITVADNTPHGAIFRFTLPASEVPDYE